MDDPRASDWIVPAVLVVMFGVGLNLTIALAPASLAAQSVALCLSGLVLVCWLAGMAQALRWVVWVRNEARRLGREAESITPLLRAAQAVRALTPEQASLLPRFMPNDTQVVFVEQEQELVAHFYTEEGLVPWDFIERFLLLSNNLDLMPVSSTSDKTPERAYCTGMTNACIRKGWAVPAVGPHPAQWRDGGRAKAAKYFQIKLRNGSGAEPEPEEEL